MVDLENPWTGKLQFGSEIYDARIMSIETAPNGDKVAMVRWKDQPINHPTKSHTQKMFTDSANQKREERG